jgi:hypothetical protein
MPGHAGGLDNPILSFSGFPIGVGNDNAGLDSGQDHAGMIEVGSFFYPLFTIHYSLVFIHHQLFTGVCFTINHKL